MRAFGTKYDYYIWQDVKHSVRSVSRTPRNNSSAGYHVESKICFVCPSTVRVDFLTNLSPYIPRILRIFFQARELYVSILTFYTQKTRTSTKAARLLSREKYRTPIRDVNEKP